MTTVGKGPSDAPDRPVTGGRGWTGTRGVVRDEHATAAHDSVVLTADPARVRRSRAFFTHDREGGAGLLPTTVDAVFAPTWPDLRGWLDDRPAG